MSINKNITNLVTYSKLIDISDSAGANAVDDIFIVDPARGPFLATDLAFCMVSATSIVSITATVGVRAVGTTTVDSSILAAWSIPSWNAVNQWIYPVYGTTVKVPVSIASGSTVSFKNSAASNGTLVRITVVIQGYYLHP